MANKCIEHWINGVFESGSSTRTAPVFDPALGEETARVRLGAPEDLALAATRACQAQPAWANLSLARRTAVVFRFRELLNARKKELAAIITAEHGKLLSDSLGEVSRGQEVVEYACGIGSHLKGEFSDQVSTGVDVHSIRQPIGVAAIISPFNFPAMVPMWFFPIAIAAGNAVILKPSEKDPSAAIWLAELWQEAGLPDGIFNVVHGDKEIVDAILANPDIKSVSFVGSTPVARYIYETSAKYGKRVQALGGAKNHMLVLPDADLDLVADSAVNAGFGSAGERCMAVSVVVVVEPAADQLVNKIRERMLRLRTGDGRRGCDMGPLITREHRNRVVGYIDIAQADRATIVLDGRSVQADGEAGGFWLGPTLIDRVPIGSKVYTDEIFGPVLLVVRVKSFDEGLKIINASPYGNGSAIFTNDGGAARRFSREVTAGMVGVNVPIPVPVATFSFGGFKDSLFGDMKAHGKESVRFFTQVKAVTTRWLDPSHGGINLGFPKND